MNTDRSPLRDLVEKLVRWDINNSAEVSLQVNDKYQGPDYYWSDQQKKEHLDKMKTTGVMGQLGWGGASGTPNGPTEKYYSPTITILSHPDILDRTIMNLSMYDIKYYYTKGSTKFKLNLTKKPEFYMIFNMLKVNYPDLNEKDILNNGCQYLKSLLYEPEEEVEVDLGNVSFDLLPDEKYFDKYRKAIDEIISIKK